MVLVPLLSSLPHSVGGLSQKRSLPGGSAVPKWTVGSQVLPVTEVHVACLGSCGLSRFMWPVEVHVACLGSCGLSRFMWPVEVHVACRSSSSEYSLTMWIKGILVLQ